MNRQEENSAIIARCIAGDESARNEFCTKNLGLAKSSVARYLARHPSARRIESDLLSAAQMGLVIALNKLVKRGGAAKIGGYCSSIISSEIRREARSQAEAGFTDVGDDLPVVRQFADGEDYVDPKAGVPGDDWELLEHILVRHCKTDAQRTLISALAEGKSMEDAASLASMHLKAGYRCRRDILDRIDAERAAELAE